MNIVSPEHGLPETKDMYLVQQACILVKTMTATGRDKRDC